MKNQRKSGVGRGCWFFCSALLLAGCQQGLTGFPNLGNPSRIPPPPSGTFQIPPNYSDAMGSNKLSSVSNLGQLRALETGRANEGRITPDGFAAVESNGDAPRPIVAQAIPSPFATSSSVQPASVFASATDPPPIVTATSSSNGEVTKSSVDTLGSSDGQAEVQWTVPQR